MQIKRVVTGNILYINFKRLILVFFFIYPAKFRGILHTSASFMPSKTVIIYQVTDIKMK